MHTLTLKSIFGSLLHDIGKLAWRSGASGKHSESGYELLKELGFDSDILDCVRYHHHDEIETSGLCDDSPAYITYIADNISSAADRRDIEEECIASGKRAPLVSIFNLLNGSYSGEGYNAASLSSKIIYPFKEAKFESESCRLLLEGLKDGLKGISCDEEYLNSLLSLLESYLSYVPSSTEKKKGVHDISLFDHVKITAACSACISEYLQNNEKNDYKTELLKKSTTFYNVNAFILLSGELDGKDEFIYDVPSNGALKEMKGRAFFSEILIEHFIDTLIKASGCSRANLIYSGGGTFMLLLPNTPLVQKKISDIRRTFQKWLCLNFGNSLSLLTAFKTCSSNDLKNKPYKDMPLKNIYEELQYKIDECRLNAYDAETVKYLNSCNNPSGDECKSCGRQSGNLSGDGRCAKCSSFLKAAVLGQAKEVVFSIVSDVSGMPETSYLELPADNNKKSYLVFGSRAEAVEMIKSGNIIRVYSKNNPYTGFEYASNIYMGDYSFSSDIGEMCSSEAGLRKMGICRLNTDDFLKSFSEGFENKYSNDIEERGKYITISRTAAFSREISRFFRYHINYVLDNEKDERLCRLLGIGEKKRVSIIISGGNEIIFTGRWNDVIYSAAIISNSLKRLSLERVSASCGISVCDEKYPVRSAAYEAEQLLEAAKAFNDGTSYKNAVALFSVEEVPKHVYNWDIFREEVLLSKLLSLRDFFSLCNEKGNSLLYRLLDLLRNADKKINLARLAYLLTRLETECEDKAAYGVFSKKVYDWAKSPEDRRQLITAIYIYVYLKRQE